MTEPMSPRDSAMKIKYDFGSGVGFRLDLAEKLAIKYTTAIRQFERAKVGVLVEALKVYGAEKGNYGKLAQEALTKFNNEEM